MDARRSDDLHYLWWLVVAIVAGLLLYLLSPILTPFLLAAILAYICNPPVQRMVARRMPRIAAVVLVLLLLAAAFVVLLLIMLPLLVKQVQAIAGQMPVYVDWIRTTLAPRIESYLGVELNMALVRDWLLEHISGLQELAVKLLPSIKSGGYALIAIAVNLVLVPVVLFYFLRDWNRMVESVDEVIPRRWHAKVVALVREIDEVLGEFLRGQLLVMLAMGVYYTLGLWLAGLDYALAVGMLSGLVTFVPYLGFIVGVVLATLTGLLQFGDPVSLIWIWVVFIAGNLLEGYVLVPRMVGERIGLHPVAVIFALLAFGQLFGFFGVLLALPASAALLVWLRQVRRNYLESGAYGA